jgi:pimeloyl-ACP methyl ester carboxylesterase
MDWSSPAAPLIKGLVNGAAHMAFIKWPFIDLSKVEEQFPGHNASNCRLQVPPGHGDSGAEVGVWVLEHPRPKLVVVYSHGQHSTRAKGHRKDLCKFLHDEVCATVVSYDPRGYGDSRDIAGRTCTPDAAIRDGLAVLDWWFQRNSSSLPVVLWGHSLGGPQAAELARRSGDRVRGLVLQASFPNLQEAAADHFLSLPLWLIPRMQRVSLIKGVVDTACEGSEFDFDTARILARLRPGLPVHPRRLPAAPAAPAPDAAAPPC